METLDIILLFIVGLFGVQGMRRGFLLQVIWFFALLAGIWLTIRFSGYVSRQLISRLDASADSIPLWSFGMTFAGAVVGVYFFVHLFKGTLRFFRLAWVDRVLGLAFGMLKGVLLLSVVMAMLAYGGVLGRVVPAERAERSVLYKPIRGFALSFFPYLKDFGTGARQRFERFGCTVSTRSALVCGGAFGEWQEEA